MVKLHDFEQTAKWLSETAAAATNSELTGDTPNWWLEYQRNMLATLMAPKSVRIVHSLPAESETYKGWLPSEETMHQNLMALSRSSSPYESDWTSRISKLIARIEPLTRPQWARRLELIRSGEIIEKELVPPPPPHQLVYRAITDSCLIDEHGAATPE